MMLFRQLKIETYEYRKQNKKDTRRGGKSFQINQHKTLSGTMHDAWRALCPASWMSPGQGPPFVSRQGAPKPRPVAAAGRFFSSDGFLDGLRRRSKGRSLLWSAEEISGEDLDRSWRRVKCFVWEQKLEDNDNSPLKKNAFIGFY
ncbi:hypothetical protein HNY73_020753 [Argiope bruennichi]|uniref:Uncharacterized protein n=1 Tax=Argiope bruennichi TaxID=94029 RepID=A0A8T0E7R7_ARGBR|nr:hypothetical protein HNY73_020753 [Argiope bruennichi]